MIHGGQVCVATQVAAQSDAAQSPLSFPENAQLHEQSLDIGVFDDGWSEWGQLERNSLAKLELVSARGWEVLPSRAFKWRARPPARLPAGAAFGQTLSQLAQPLSSRFFGSRGNIALN